MNRIEKMKKFLRENEDMIYVTFISALSVSVAAMSIQGARKDEKLIQQLVDMVKETDIAAVNTRTNDDGVFQVKVTQKNGTYSIWNKTPDKK